MKLLTLLASIAAAIWMPVAFMDAMELQAHIDARNATAERLARITK